MESPEAEAAPNLVAFAGRCTLHGIRHVFLAGPLTPRRTAWAAAVLAALGIVLYQVAERIQHYAAYSHVTALEEEEGRRLTFPAVTFCNVNWVRRSRLTPSDLHWAGRELLGVERSDHPAYD
ncbi:acid-sensing ion channel 3-like [Crotalus tigris]|uniref:acid-sensing ion channel 3-like n=1 Tax=Crotalus tigris TaxID=88082 RepID=UPI00192F3648|nr:acid-sensing ion channel 3-like [Crotalus tigris]